ncbi:hypothetical protein HRG_012150 [Hirsutella rhossiliensis]
MVITLSTYICAAAPFNALYHSLCTYSVKEANTKLSKDLKSHYYAMSLPVQTWLQDQSGKTHGCDRAWFNRQRRPLGTEAKHREPLCPSSQAFIMFRPLLSDIVFNPQTPVVCKAEVETNTIVSIGGRRFSLRETHCPECCLWTLDSSVYLCKAHLLQGMICHPSLIHIQRVLAVLHSQVFYNSAKLPHTPWSFSNQKTTYPDNPSENAMNEGLWMGSAREVKNRRHCSEEKQDSTSGSSERPVARAHWHLVHASGTFGTHIAMVVSAESADDKHLGWDGLTSAEPIQILDDRRRVRCTAVRLRRSGRLQSRVPRRSVYHSVASYENGSELESWPAPADCSGISASASPALPVFPPLQLRSPSTLRSPTSFILSSSFRGLSTMAHRDHDVVQDFENQRTSPITNGEVIEFLKTLPRQNPFGFFDGEKPGFLRQIYLPLRQVFGQPSFSRANFLKIQQITHLEIPNSISSHFPRWLEKPIDFWENFIDELPRYSQEKIEDRARTFLQSAALLDKQIDHQRIFRRFTFQTSDSKIINPDLEHKHPDISPSDIEIYGSIIRRGKRLVDFCRTVDVGDDNDVTHGETNDFGPLFFLIIPDSIWENKGLLATDWTSTIHHLRSKNIKKRLVGLSSQIHLDSQLGSWVSVAKEWHVTVISYEEAAGGKHGQPSTLASWSQDMVFPPAQGVSLQEHHPLNWHVLGTQPGDTSRFAFDIVHTPSDGDQGLQALVSAACSADANLLVSGPEANSNENTRSEHEVSINRLFGLNYDLSYPGAPGGGSAQTQQETLASLGCHWHRTFLRQDGPTAPNFDGIGMSLVEFQLFDSPKKINYASLRNFHAYLLGNVHFLSILQGMPSFHLFYPTTLARVYRDEVPGFAKFTSSICSEYHGLSISLQPSVYMHRLVHDHSLVFVEVLLKDLFIARSRVTHMGRPERGNKYWSLF